MRCVITRADYLANEENIIYLKPSSGILHLFGKETKCLPILWQSLIQCGKYTLIIYVFGPVLACFFVYVNNIMRIAQQCYM